MKQAIILGAGRGVRLGDLGKVYPKIALPIGNVPLYQIHVDMLYKQGITHFIFVLAPDMKELQQNISNLFKLNYSNAKLEFVVQRERKGIAHALYLCRNKSDKQFILLLGDTLFDVKDLSIAFNMLQKHNLYAVLSVRKENDPEIIKKECSVSIDENGYIIRIIEKPKKILSNIKPCGIYFFTDDIFNAIDATKPSKLRNEIEITDAIGELIKSTDKVGTAFVVNFDINITYLSDFLLANMFYLKKSGLKNIIASDAKIGEHVVIERSVIGSNVIIQNNSIIKNSVILPFSTIKENSNLVDSLVMRNIHY